MTRHALLLDFDGTVANSLPLCVAAFQVALRQHLGADLTPAQVMAHFGVGSEEGIFQQLLPERWEPCLASYLEAYERLHHLCPAPFPGVRALLARLRGRGVRLALITGKGAHSAAISLRRLGLGDAFDAVRTGLPHADVKEAQIPEVLAALGVAPAHAAYAGDFPGDVRAARAAGVRALAAAWAPGTDLGALAAAGPEAILHTTDELDRWIEAWLARGASPAAA